MTTDTPSDELLARYVAGEAAVQERAAVERWASAEPGRQAELERLESAWKSRASTRWNVAMAWERTSARLGQPQGVPFPQPAFRWVAIAAVLLLAAGVTWLARRNDGASTPNRLTEYRTGPAERKSVMLGDGTRLELAAATRVRITSDYGRVERRVDLEGAAWFQVRHDAARPFRVYTRTTVTEDLGTEFEISAPAGTDLVRVTVASGSVSLRAANAPASPGTTLGANDVATLSADGQTRVQSGAPVDRLLSWRRGTLIFEDDSLATVLARLKAWYGVPLALADPSLAGLRLSATIRLTALDEAVEVVTMPLGLTTERRGDTLVLRAR